jgi:hypothetical protein
MRGLMYHLGILNLILYIPLNYPVSLILPELIKSENANNPISPHLSTSSGGTARKRAG